MLHVGGTSHTDRGSPTELVVSCIYFTIGSRAVLPRDARTRVAVVEEDRHFGPRDAADLARVELPVRPRRYDADTDRGRLCELLLRLSQYTSVTYMRLGVSKQIFPGICGVDFQKIPGNIQGIQF